MTVMYDQYASHELTVRDLTYAIDNSSLYELTIS